MEISTRLFFLEKLFVVCFYFLFVLISLSLSLSLNIIYFEKNIAAKYVFQFIAPTLRKKTTNPVKRKRVK